MSAQVASSTAESSFRRDGRSTLRNCFGAVEPAARERNAQKNEKWEHFVLGPPSGVEAGYRRAKEHGLAQLLNVLSVGVTHAAPKYQAGSPRARALWAPKVLPARDLQLRDNLQAVALRLMMSSFAARPSPVQALWAPTVLPARD